jgi:hypothetical protein
MRENDREMAEVEAPADADSANDGENPPDSSASGVKRPRVTDRRNGIVL